jgi:hypothetical protein
VVVLLNHRDRLSCAGRNVIIKQSFGGPKITKVSLTFTRIVFCSETMLRILQHEIETLFANGDMLTFSKVVSAGSYHVAPVMARI